MIHYYREIVFFLLSICIWSADSSDDLCPISTDIDALTNGFISYPESFFADGSYFPNGITTYNCVNYADEENLIFQKCVHSYGKAEMCPLKQENIQATLAATKWQSRTKSICDIAQKNAAPVSPSEEKPIVRLFYIGGSFTAGSKTVGGCICNLDDKCPKLTFGLEIKSENFCSWGAQFSRWFEKKFSNLHVESYNYGQSGAPSFISAEQLYGKLLRDNIKFSSNDVVFIDQSVNDAWFKGISGRTVEIKEGIESLIRRIIHYCEEECPSIIILNQFAHNTEHPLTHKPSDGPNTISGIYEDVASHYHLPLWSYKDFVWSDYTTTNQSQLQHHIIIHSIHPPWYVHLLYAEVVADVFSHTATSCDVPDHPNSNDLPNLSLSSLPSPYYDILNFEHTMCDMSAPFLLNIEPNSSVPHPEDLESYENNPEEAGKGWRLYVDKHEIPGYIINDYAKLENRKISFHLNDIGELISSKPRVIKITYLQTYKNAGKVEVFLCGNRLEWVWEIDALHGDHYKYKVSVPKILPHSISGAEAGNCDSKPPQERTMDFVFMPTTSEKEIRQHQKFKLLSVHICNPSDLA